MASPAPAPPSASAASRRQRASYTVVSPTAHHNSQHHQQQQQQQYQILQQHSSLVPGSHHGLDSSPGHGHASSNSNHPNNSNNSNSNSGNGNSGGAAQNPQYPDVYAHPAAVAYSAAHPRRTIPKFGPYLLLQTLGEGEFGKVKLGLHSQWGEEVAVKLIRRGNVDSTVRMSKVEREIEVLKTLKHPNIVRLYDVIETDKYIGIILEYASGGELFDHILAHRYLREKDAARLFSQLISGVWYIHQKKIVHRDLKLENLLLDRNRNVIITDFGFANRFEHKTDDLMQTSCGSPCYAAPELVISEGLYVGSAVDIWSCGVILYAMLAGYLPFDDDPANPDGDNINLLYKYIVSTPLSFPEYISGEARDLLGMMLVPDPTRRTTLEGVMRHPWLGAYWVEGQENRGAPVAFGRTVDELERAAMEGHQAKRVAYQKQMRAAAAASAGGGSSAGAASGNAAANSGGGALAVGGGNAGTVAPSPGRTQSHRPAEHRDRERERERDAQYSQQQQQSSRQAQQQQQQQQGAATPRSRSTQPEYLYDSSLDQSMASPGGPGSVSMPVHSASASASASASGYPSQQPQQGQQGSPATPTTTGKGKKPAGGSGSGGKVFGSPAALGLSEDDPFAFAAGPPSASAGASSGMPVIPTPAQSLAPPGIPANSNSGSGGKTGGGGDKFRHTIQVEYDAPKGRKRSGSQSQGQATSPGAREREAKEREAKERERDAKERERQQQQQQDRKPKPLPSTPPVAASSPTSSPATTTATATAMAAPSAYRPPVSSATPPTSASTTTNANAHGPVNGNGLVVNVSQAVTSLSGSTFTSASASNATPSTPASSSASNAHTPEGSASATGTTGSTSSIRPPSVSGHKKGKSSVDRMGLGKIFGGLGGGGGSQSSRDEGVNGGGDGDVTPGGGSVASVQLTPSASVSEEDKEGKGNSSREAVGKKTSRRNTLTVMVEPFTRSVRGRKDKERGKTPTAALHPQNALGIGGRDGSKSALPGAGTSTTSGSNSMLAVPVPGPVSAVEPSAGGGGVPAFSPSQEFGAVPPGLNGMHASTSKAKKVMQWFRTKSKGRESVGFGVSGGGGGGGEDEVTPTPTQQGQGYGQEMQQQQSSATPIQAKYRRGYSASSSTVNQPGGESDGERGRARERERGVVVVPATAAPVQVVVTTPTTPRAASKTPIQPLRTASGATDASASGASISASSFVTRFRNSVTAVGRERQSSTTGADKRHHHHHHHQNQHAHSHQQGQLQQQQMHPYSQLRIHHGAVDQTTITTRPPPEVIAHVKRVLEGMGVEAQMESEYKVRCVRVKRKKVDNVSAAGQEGQGHGEGQLAVVTMVGTAASNGVDKRGLPLPSPSAFGGTGGMLRGLLMRRQSSQVSTHGPASSSASASASGTVNSLAFDDNSSVVVGEPMNMSGQDALHSPISPSASPLTATPPTAFIASSSGKGGKGPAYGDPNQDAGDEVRFSVELTRLDRLNDTYSLDIRRLKGNLRSYKFLYDTLRERADLSAAH